MESNRRVRRLVALTALVAAACAGGGGGGPSGYQASLGAVEPDKLLVDTRDYLRRIGYDIEVENGPPAILVRSFWRSALPTDEERAAGATEARTRFRVTGRSRQMSEASEVYVTTLRIDHQVRMGPDAAWEEMPASSDFLEWARTTARELELQLQSGRGG